MAVLFEEDATLVEVRGETWRLARRERFDTCTVLTLVGRDPGNAGLHFRVIEPFDRPRPIGKRKLRARSRRAAMTAALAAIAGARAPSALWTAASASIDLLPYQLEPALAVIRGATRLLLADAVGLGKTIQAGLILSELRERGWVEHALIVCPAGLRFTWAHELGERFHISAAVLDQAAIAERIASLPPGVSPWSGHGVTIASIDFVKRPEVLSAIDREPIDLLIADEAHHLAPGTDRGAAISRLASRAPWCVFVSATPHSGDPAAFEYLTSLGAAGDSIAIFRRRRSDAGLSRSRRTHLLAVAPSAPESLLFAAIERYARAIWAACGRDDPAVRLVAMTMARRATSSTSAIARTVQRRLSLMAVTPVEPAQTSLPWEETETADDIEADGLLGVAGLGDVREERAALEQLIALAAECRLSTKFQRLARLLDRVREPALVFTEYRDTLASLVAHLAPARQVLSIHGGLPPDSRRDIVDAFNAGRADVLVATDAAGEGLNLHHRCRLVVDLELPWNPLRLEQRVGRVDRLGQQRIVHAVRLFHPGTVESSVLEHLRLRRRRAEDALDGPTSDAAVAAAIFEGASIDSAAISLRTDAIDASAEAVRLQRQRRSTARGVVTNPSLAPPRHASQSPVIAVQRLSMTNGNGSLVGEQIRACRIEPVTRPATLRDWRELAGHIDSIVEPDGRSDLPARDVLVARIHALRPALKSAAAIRYQRSLFDQRPDAEAAAREAVVRRLEEALVRILRSIDTTNLRTKAELIALWPELRG